MMKIDTLIKKSKEFDFQAISKAISLIQEGDLEFLDSLGLPEDLNTETKVIGITGVPGAGKSTLTGQLVKHLASSAKIVVVIAIDPSSPISGGAVLGDRIRMSQASSLDNVFIRSLASRGRAGALTQNIDLILRFLRFIEVDYVILETVGAGQSDTEVSNLVDSLILVLTPGLGDEVQSLKAGIFEVADLYVINKSDYQGADRLYKELLDVTDKANIFKTIATEDSGVDDIVKRLLES